MLHRAVITGLAPATRYYYVYGDDAAGDSDEASFLSAPAPGPGASVRLIALADMGQARSPLLPVWECSLACRAPPGSLVYGLVPGARGLAAPRRRAQ